MPVLTPSFYHDGRKDGSVRQFSLSKDLERLNNPNDGVKELHQRWDDRLVLPLSKLREQYCRSNIVIVLECITDNSLLLEGQRFTLFVERKGFSELGRNVGRHGEVHPTANQYQFPMLVDSVHLVDDCERVINSVASSVVWLQGDDSVPYSAIRDSLYLSLKSFDFLWRRRITTQDWEGYGATVFSSIFVRGKEPNEMIEGRTQMMDDFPRKNAEAKRNCELAMIINRLLPFLVLRIGDSRIFAGLKEGADLGLKIQDVLVGPF